MQSTEACRTNYLTCNGKVRSDAVPGGRASHKLPITARMNRHDGPEDATLAERCLTGGLPGIGGNSFRRIVRRQAASRMFYDVGQGQG
jgi:hypothetical protein